MKSPATSAKHLQASENITLIEGQGNYSLMHRTNARPELFSLTLKRFEEWLPTWLRVSRTYLINPAFAEGIRRLGVDNWIVVTKDGQTIQIARRRIKQIKTLLNHDKRNAY